MRGLTVLWCLTAAAAQGLIAQGLPFYTETALTTAFEERGIRSFASTQARGDADTFLSPLVLLPFAPHQRVTTKVVIPLVYKRLRADPKARYSNTGVGDLILDVKWAFFVRNRRNGTMRMAVVGSALLPTGSTSASFNNGMKAPRSFQLGQGAFGGGMTLVGTVVRDAWGLSADIGHHRSTADHGYRPGSMTQYNLAIGFRLPRYIETIRTRTVQFYVEWNGSVTGRNSQDDITLANSGGHMAYLSPGVQWVVLPQLLIEASVQVPVVQDHNGTQADFGIRPALGARLLFF